jgi:hypothetical protein
MTVREFMYWLQGYFEITDSEIYPKDFEKKVQSHIELTKLCDPNPNPVLKSNLALIALFLQDRNYPALKKVLFNTFHHAIDGTYNVDQSLANQIHSGIQDKPVDPPKPPKQHAWSSSYNNPNGATMRC